MKIKKSNALSYFKKEVGQANHMLITIMIGLDEVQKNEIELSPEFRVSWNPSSKYESVRRSKLFAKKSVFAWVTDCIDTYLRVINKSPSIIQSGELKNTMDNENNSRSVYKRINIVCDYCEINSENRALINLLICWRNKLNHYGSDNDISKENRQLLESNCEEIKAKYSNLDIIETLSSFDSSGSPTFKEVASFIKSSIDLIYAIDAYLVGKLNYKNYADQVLIKYFNKNEKERLNNIFSKSRDIKLKSIRQLLMQYGFYIENAFNEVDELCEAISDLSFDEAKSKYDNRTFI